MEMVENPSISKLMNLSGKTALVTGGAVGIGQGIALRLAEAGAAVLVGDIRDEEGRKTVDAIRARNAKAEFVHLDVSRVDDIRTAIQTGLDRFGGLDILVNNAGVFPFHPLNEITETVWDHVFGVNLKGAFFAAQISAAEMIRQGRGGRIINIGSIDAIHPTGNLVHYDSSKGGMLMMTRSLALELGRYGILVNSVLPGGIMTPGAQEGGVEMMRALGMTPEQMQAQSVNFLARIPLHRQGVPDDIARVTLFLASGLADYITGESIVVDGGYLLS